MAGALLHAALLLAMTVATGWTWAKVSVALVWIAVAHFEQRRGSSLGTHWTAPAIGVSWFALTVLVMSSAAEPGVAAGVFGCGLMALGALLRGAAIVALGPGYSDGVQPVRPLVQDGVYAHLDHPGELGALALAVGASLAVGSSWALGWFLVALLPLTLYRFRLEERFLCLSARESCDALAV